MDRQTDWRKGVMPGIVAGFIFLAATDEVGAELEQGMLDIVGDMVNAGGTPLVGFVIHLIISAVVGALYTGLYTRYAQLGENRLVNAFGGGLIYGLLFWIIGGNIIQPVLAGGALLQLDIGAASFFGHIIFGLCLAWFVSLQEGG